MKEFKYDVIQLIQGIRDRPCLWDKTKENYKDRVERRGAWEEIFNTLDEKYEEMTPEEKRLTGEHILNKWTNVRDTFMKSLKNRMGKPKRRYVLYDHLKFLTKIKPEECNIDQDEFVNESNEEITFMKQEIDSQEVQLLEIPEASYVPKIRQKRSDYDKNASNYCVIEASYSKKKRSKRNDVDEQSTDGGSDGSYNPKKKSKRLSIELSDGKDTFSKRKSKRDRSKTSIHDGSVNDIDFVEVDEADNPRLMNEDEAFFASLLPTVVKYNEDERLEFRIEVLGVMKKIKDKLKWPED